MSPELEARRKAYYRHLRRVKMARECRPRPYSPCLSWRPIINAICERHGFAPEDVMRHARLVEIVACRQEVWATIRDTFGTSYPEIGRRLGGFNHCTVILGIRKFKATSLAQKYANSPIHHTHHEEYAHAAH